MQFDGVHIEAALEATTGWRFMVEELRAIGAEVHLAEPAETRTLRGPKRRAKTDRADSKHLRELLQQRRVPESWIPPEQILELRSLVRLRRSLVEQRTAWLQRIHAQLFHHGHPARRDLLVRERRAWVETLELPHAARTQVKVALQIIDHVNVQLGPLDRELRQIANSWPGAKALQAHYGIGPLTAVALLAELGDATRFSSSRKAVRYAGLDITVSESDSKRAPGKLSRQGPATLRWAAFEAARSAHKPSSPDHDYYLAGRQPSRRQPRLPRARAETAAARLPHAARARRGGASARMTPPANSVRALPPSLTMTCGQLLAFRCCHGTTVDSPERLSGRNTTSGITPSTIMSPAPPEAVDRRPLERSRSPGA